jgi:restriction system protein
MPIPGFQDFMLPFLLALNDKAEHRVSDVRDILASQFKLTAEEREALLPSGNQAIFQNRVAWAASYLNQAGLLTRTGKGVYLITERGIAILKEGPKRIDIPFLTRFPEFERFRRRTASPQKTDSAAVIEIDPAEALERNYLQLRETLSDDLLDRISNCSPAFFERLVVDLLVAMGYGGSRKDAGQTIGRSGDDGIDGMIKEDKLGLDAIYVQAKRWEGPVGRPVVQAFAGSLEGQRAKKGVLITTSRFSQDAKDYVNRIDKKIVLIDGEQLGSLIIDHGVGVANVNTYHVKRVDLDYFEEE